MNHIAQAIEQLRSELELARRRGRRSEADFLESIISDLEHATAEDWRELFEQVLPLSEAARRAGYDPSAFTRERRKFSAVPLPSGGDGVRVCDCPCKPGRLLVLLGLQPISDADEPEGSLPAGRSNGAASRGDDEQVEDDLARFRQLRGSSRKRKRWAHKPR